MRAGFREEDSIGNFTNFREREMAKQRPIELRGKLPKRKKNCRNIRQKCGRTRARLPTKPRARAKFGIRGWNCGPRPTLEADRNVRRNRPSMEQKRGLNLLYNFVVISSAQIDVPPGLYTVPIDRLQFQQNRRLRKGTKGKKSAGIKKESM